VVTVLGAVFALSGNVHALIVTAVGLAAAGTVSMAGGEWLSDSNHGLGASVVIGLTTAVGTLAPVLPYMLPFLDRGGQIFWSVYVCLLVGLVIARVRSMERGWRRGLAETYGVLFVAAGAAWLAAWATGAVG
jgi:VIT1/CCC1 family predicted Fe2+/Mn2+ transporter